MADPTVNKLRRRTTVNALLARCLLRAAVEGVSERTKEHRTSQPLSFQRAPSGLSLLMVPVGLIPGLSSPPFASLEIYVPSSVC